MSVLILETITHNGDWCPIPLNTLVFIKTRSGEALVCKAMDEGYLRQNNGITIMFYEWKHSGNGNDIVAYCPIEIKERVL